MNDVVLEAEQLEKALRIIEAHGYTPISKKAKIDEAIKIAREAGYKVSRINERFGNEEGTTFTKICEKYVSGGYFFQLAKEKNLAEAISQYLEDVKPYIGHGISQKYYDSMAARIVKCKSKESALFIISNAMLAGQGMALK